ncbi:unnamed protein product [Zymoseptoria tritici ST99CH_1E4]|nr:unnamed protein product [Zymoseptoria tritici ST99CH_1E4]
MRHDDGDPHKKEDEKNQPPSTTTTTVQGRSRRPKRETKNHQKENKPGLIPLRRSEICSILIGSLGAILVLVIAFLSVRLIRTTRSPSPPSPTPTPTPTKTVTSVSTVHGVEETMVTRLEDEEYDEEYDEEDDEEDDEEEEAQMSGVCLDAAGELSMCRVTETGYWA